MKVDLDEILQFLSMSSFSVKIVGRKELSIEGFCSLKKPRPNSILWIKDVVAYDEIETDALKHCIVVAKQPIPIKTSEITFLITENPKAVFFAILHHFWGEKKSCGIAKTAIVESTRVAPDVSIGHHCYVGPDVVIESGTLIEHNVSIIGPVMIGEKCIIHSGTVIGTDGFGYYENKECLHEKVEHFGGVIIGDNVEIGANACIDRGTIDNTVIEKNSKIDNLVHIAHNVQVGPNSLIIAGAVICGSAQLGENSYIAPGGIVRNQILVGDNGFVGLGAVVTENVNKNMIVVGVPAKPYKQRNYHLVYTMKEK